MEPSDRELARRISQGDEGALGVCYDRYAARVLGLLLKLVGNRQDAEDLLQATFLEAWRYSRRYDPSRSGIASWLLLIARSRAVDHLRRRTVTGTTWAEASEPFTPDELSDDLERAEAGGRLRDALRQLPQDQSEAITCAFLAEMTHAEIAKHLNVPLGTIKTRIRLGMNRLRDILVER
jgi:RNA polymerase sigma-70 factor (ECF subfamily)